MKKKLLTVILAALLTLTACGEPQYYNESKSADWASFNRNNKDCHVNYVVGEDSFFSDGSSYSNRMMKIWLTNKQKMDNIDYSELEYGE